MSHKLLCCKLQNYVIKYGFPGSHLSKYVFHVSACNSETMFTMMNMLDIMCTLSVLMLPILPKGVFKIMKD